MLIAGYFLLFLCMTAYTQPYDPANVEEIIGQKRYDMWVTPTDFTLDSLNLGLFYTTPTGDTFPFYASDGGDTFFITTSITGDTIYAGKKDFILAGAELPTTTGWEVAMTGEKGLPDSLSAKYDALPHMEPLEFHGSDSTKYWIKTSETEFGYNMFDTVSISLDFYPLGGTATSGPVEYRGSSYPDTYWEADIVPPILTWDADTESVAIGEQNNLPFITGIRLFPNPFNSAVSISAPEGAGIKIFDINGRMVDEISVGEGHRALPSGVDMETGSTQGCSPTNIVWTPDKSLGSGVYLVRATILEQTASAVCTRRVVYLK